MIQNKTNLSASQPILNTTNSSDSGYSRYWFHDSKFSFSIYFDSSSSSFAATSSISIGDSNNENSSIRSMILSVISNEIWTARV
jgi:hypothetical protein